MVIFLKKHLSFIFLIIAVLSLSACESASESPTPVESDPLPAESSPSINEDNPLLSAEFLSIPRGNGKYGYTYVSRDDLPDLSSEEFSDVLSGFMERVINYDGNYVIVDFGDGMGLHLIIGNSSGLYADYCEMLADNTAGYSHGYFVRDTLDEPFTFTDFHILKIPDPTIQQEALSPDNYFEPVNDVIFNTTAEENGLADMPFYAEGEVVSRSNVGGYDTIQLATDEGDLYVSATLVPLPEMSAGNHVTVYFAYAGWSDSLDAACGIYVYSE